MVNRFVLPELDDIVFVVDKKGISVSFDLQFIEALSPSSFNGGLF